MFSNRKKILLVFTAAAASILAILYQGFSKSHSSDQQVAAIAEDSPSNKQPIKDKQQIVATLRAPLVSRTKTAAPQVATQRSAQSPECEQFWSKLTTVDLNQILREQNYRHLLPRDHKCKTPPQQFAVVTTMYADACLEQPSKLRDPQGNPLSPEDQQRACYQSLLSYRALIIDTETSDLLANEISDPVLLAHKTIAKMQYAPQEALTYAERLLETDNEFYPAAKIVAILQLAKMSETKGNPASKDSAIAAIQRAAEMNPEDGELYKDLQSAVRMSASTSKEEQLNEARAIVAEDPARTENLYLSSWIAFKEGDYKAANQRLGLALQKNPANPRYLATKTELESIGDSPEATERSIYGFSVDFDPADLFP